MRYVLIEAIPTIDNPENNPICVHAIIDESDHIEGKHALFGVYGNWQRKEEDFAPFVLGPEGKIDFGSGYDRADTAGDRFCITKLRDVTIRQNALFNLLSEKWGNKTYRISNVTPLPMKSVT